MTHFCVGATRGDLDQPEDQSVSDLATTVSPGLSSRNLRGSHALSGCEQGDVRSGNFILEFA
jgi:hypothetical protein